MEIEPINEEMSDEEMWEWDTFCTGPFGDGWYSTTETIDADKELCMEHADQGDLLAKEKMVRFIIWKLGR